MRLKLQRRGSGNSRKSQLQALPDESTPNHRDKTWSIEEILAEAEAEGADLVFGGPDEQEDDDEEFMKGPSINMSSDHETGAHLPSGDDMTRILSAYGEAEPKNSKDITVEELQSLLQSDSPCLLLDVRSEQEFNSGHVPGAIHIPLESLVGRISAGEVEIEDRTVAVVCASGSRSARAVLELKTFCKVKDVVNVKGGTLGWMSAGYAVER